MKIGILFPRSSAHPRVGIDLMEGLKLYLKKHALSNTISFITESIGFGGSEKEVYAKAEKLLLMEDVDILIGFVDEKVVDVLKPLIYASGKLLIMVNAGANYPSNWISQPNIINLNLQHAFLCAVTGSSACSGKAVNGVVASTFYDCGYLQTAAIAKEFLKCGGHIRFNYINNQPYDNAFQIDPLTDFLRTEKNTNNLLCVFDALPASLFYKLLNNYEYAGDLKLFVSPMMLDQKALETGEGGFNFSIEGYIPWHPSIRNEENRDFTSTYEDHVKKPTTIFALLGWETGIILQHIHLLFKNDYRDGIAIADSIKNALLKSPRGKLKLDPVSQHFITPVIKCVLYKGAAKMEMEVRELEKEWEDFTDAPTDGMVSGWTNTYLCY